MNSFSITHFFDGQFSKWTKKGKNTLVLILFFYTHYTYKYTRNLHHTFMHNTHTQTHTHADKQTLENITASIGKQTNHTKRQVEL